MSTLADQVVSQVHTAIGGMYPVSSVGYDEADEIIRAAITATLLRITGTGIGKGTARQVDIRLRNLAREVSEPAESCGTAVHEAVERIAKL